MSEFFQNPEDLKYWVLSKENFNNAAKDLINMIKIEENQNYLNNNQEDIFESCKVIFEKNDGSDNASEVLFGVLAKHNLTKLQKSSSRSKREIVSESRQRNDWERGQRNKWNRSIDGFNENTPWRVSRDKYYDFTHYHTDEIKFDEDPNHIYSGEAIWRTYVMDKYYRDCKDKNGNVVGGYINDRFYVFPYAGTPANPKVPRTGGNQMELPDGVRTMKPRPHQYSMERRLEEQRKNEKKAVANLFDKTIKIASNKNFNDAKNSKIYNIFKDTIEMREAGVEYGTILEEVSKHYDTSILNVAQIDKFATNLVKKHNKIAYVKESSTLFDSVGYLNNTNIIITEENGVEGMTRTGKVYLPQGTVIIDNPNSSSFKIIENPNDSSLIGTEVFFKDMDFDVEIQDDIQKGAEELGLNE